MKIDGSKVVGLILAGGQSSRLFPFNKVLSDLTGSGRTLLQQAFDRLIKKPGALTAKEDVYVLTARESIPAMAKQLGLPRRRFLADPVRRGTWPALLWAMAHIRAKNPEALLAVVTADHLIPDVPAFRRSLREAIGLAQGEQAIALVGVQPDLAPESWKSFGAFRSRGTRIIEFKEKPSPEEAGEMIREGGWLWNAGMFFYRIPVAEEALRLYQPSMADTYEAMGRSLARGQEAAAAKLFAKLPDKIPHPLDPARSVDNTMDFAIMTPLADHPSGGLSAQAAVTPLSRWLDLGQWDALRKIAKLDAQDNVRIGNVRLGAGVQDSILVADRGGRMEVSHLNGLIAAFSDHTLLLMPVSQAGDVKSFVQAAREAGPASVFEQSCEGSQFQVRRGRVLAYRVKDVSVRLAGGRVVIEGPRFIR